MTSSVGLRVIESLAKTGKISSFKLAKQLGLTEQKVHYHLDELVKNGNVRKEGTQYFLAKGSLNYKGILAVPIQAKRGKGELRYYFFKCVHFDTCGCRGKSAEECQLMRELKKSKII